MPPKKGKEDFSWMLRGEKPPDEQAGEGDGLGSGSDPEMKGSPQGRKGKAKGGGKKRAQKEDSDDEDSEAAERKAAKAKRAAALAELQGMANLACGLESAGAGAKAERGGKRKRRGRDDDEDKPSQEEKSKDGDKLKRPQSAYFLWCDEYRHVMQKRNQFASMGEIAKLLGKKWKEMSDAEKEPYEARAAEAKEKYQEELGQSKARRLSIGKRSRRAWDTNVSMQ